MNELSPDIEELYRSLHRLEVGVLRSFPDAQTVLEEVQIGRDGGLQDQEVRTACSWLLAKGLLEEASVRCLEEVSLSERAVACVQDGLPEMRIVQMIRSGQAVKVKDLDALLPGEDVRTCMGQLKKAKVIDIVEAGRLVLTEDADLSGFEALQSLLAAIGQARVTPRDQFSSQDQDLLQEHSRKRGSAKGLFKIQERRFPSYRLAASGAGIAERLRAAPEAVMGVSRLTKEMLQDGSWRKARFRPYDLSIRPPRAIPGRFHPYRSFLDKVKRKFASLGFQEMRGDLVETEFWDMDALYMPQFHPARNVHDVYFVKSPTHASGIENGYDEKVGKVHENGGDTGSRGWRYAFNPERAKRLILRSQGTALSARALGAGAEAPGKYFAMARCFRYDQIDATHLSDFYQIEGIVLGDKIHFRHLLGLLKLFAEELAGATETHYTPAYFPFTEPSVELHIRHPKLGWMELGGAGLFRPEVRLPLGCHVPVIAWGLGLDRMAVTALGIDDLRLLFSSDLEFLRTSRVSS